MAWAEEQHWFGMELDYEEQAELMEFYKNERIEMLNGYIHEDINYNKVDVRTIDSRYARNLYNWYIRKGLMPEGELKQTIMMKELEKRMK